MKVLPLDGRTGLSSVMKDVSSNHGFSMSLDVQGGYYKIHTVTNLLMLHYVFINQE